MTILIQVEAAKTARWYKPVYDGVTGKLQQTASAPCRSGHRCSESISKTLSSGSPLHTDTRGNVQVFHSCLNRNLEEKGEGRMSTRREGFRKERSI